MFDLSAPTAQFEDAAQALLKDIAAGQPEALARAGRVLHDSREFSIVHAQHTVAVEHGFQGWPELLSSNAIEQRLALTMARIPRLTLDGVGFYQLGISTEERAARVEVARRGLRAHTTTVEKTLLWLRDNVAPIKTMNERRDSYGIKHMVERDIGYLANGTLIAAGIIAGYPYKIIPGLPNVEFGMSEKSLRVIEKRQRAEQRARDRS